MFVHEVSFVFYLILIRLAKYVEGSEWGIAYDGLVKVRFVKTYPHFLIICYHIGEDTMFDSIK